MILIRFCMYNLCRPQAPGKIAEISESSGYSRKPPRFSFHQSLGVSYGFVSEGSRQPRIVAD